ncbi:MAG: hypothetical protein JWR67_3043 [Mucilaginibacter sp.]|nr:hypothetical protein [Mucilaginibacter sp.]
MISDKHKKTAKKEKEWENPVEPAMSTDERDKEQLVRQFKEAKRRKDNLSETEDTENENKKI